MGKWITEVPYDVFKGIAKLCEENTWEEKDLPQWTRGVIDKIWSQVLKDVEARNVFIKSVVWRTRCLRAPPVDPSGRFLLVVVR